MSRTEAAANLWGLRRDPPSPAARLIAALGTSTAALSQLPDLLLRVGLQLARRNWKQNENKNGETNTGKEGVRRPRAKVETGWCFLWGWFVVKWAGSFSNLEKRELGAKCLILPFLLGWPCSFLESLLWWLTYLCAYLPHQDAFKSEELHLLPRQEALMTHVLDEEDLWWAEGPQALYFNGKLNKLKDTPTHPPMSSWFQRLLEKPTQESTPLQHRAVIQGMSTPGRGVLRQRALSYLFPELNAI